MFRNKNVVLYFPFVVMHKKSLFVRIMFMQEILFLSIFIFIGHIILCLCNSCLYSDLYVINSYRLHYRKTSYYYVHYSNRFFFTIQKWSGYPSFIFLAYDDDDDDVIIENIKLHAYTISTLIKQKPKFNGTARNKIKKFNVAFFFQFAKFKYFLAV